MEQMQDICKGSVGPLPLDGANSRKCYHHKFIKYEKRLRKEGNMLGLPINNNQAKSLPLQREI
jgi:hypothetical protein